MLIVLAAIVMLTCLNGEIYAADEFNDYTNEGFGTDYWEIV